MLPSRRDFGKLAAGLALSSAAPAHETKFNGVRVCVGTYTFRGMQLDDFIPIVSAAKVAGIELDSPFVEPPRAAGLQGPPSKAERDATRQWRLTVPLEDFKAIQKKLDNAGISVYAYSLPINESFTDEEIDRVFLMTKALGSSVLHTSTNLPTANRLAPFAEKHKVAVGLHPSGNPKNAEAIGSGESYLKVFEFSPSLYANLDLYLYRNWGPDPIAFLKQIHRRITALHFHDRKLNQNPQTWVPFGEGDIPTKEILLLAKTGKYPFAFTIERLYSFPGLDQLTELRRSLDYCRKVLA